MNIYESFINPDNKYRGKPFWSWNGELNKEELIKQIHYMKDMGLGGFFMQSRVGLATEYLGEEWFELINACADEAEKLGMEAWIYDEDRWPSGTAGGKITEKKENRMKFIRMHIDEEIPEAAEVVACFECKLDKINFTDKRRIGVGEKTDKNRIWFEIKEFPKSDFYNGFTYADTLKKETTEEYIEITHEKYKKYCGKRVGSTIKGVFTDEPHRGPIMCDYMEDGCTVPYTEALFETFREKWGYGLEEYLPELFLRRDGRKVSPVKWQYIETLQQMFLDNFAKPIHDWCKENNMKFTGHVLHEDTLSAQTIMQGSLMRFYEHMDFPGVDVLTEYNTNYCIVKQLSSVAHQLGQKWLLSELYGCTGWQMNFESYKNVGDWQALTGINVRCPHLSWYTMEGEAKRDYPASILHQSAWYKDYKYVEDYFSRIGLFLDQGESVCDCLVISPIESIWSQIYAGWSTWLNTKTEDTAEIEKHYKDLCNWLLQNNVNFDFADEEMLSRLYSLEGNSLQVGKAKYNRVVISGMLTIRSSTLKIIDDFARNGGEVIVLGEQPQYVDAVPASINLNARLMEFTKESVGMLANGIITAEDERIFVEIKSDRTNTYVMMLNTDRKNSVNTKVRVGIEGNIEKWCAKSGTRFSVKNIDTLHFEAGEEKLFVITREENKLPEFKRKEYKNQGVLGDPYSYKLSEPNVCVLDFARCTVNDEVLEETDILKIDRRLREKYKLGYRGGEMLQPWFVNQKQVLNFDRIKLEYDFYVEGFSGDLELVIENAKSLDISLNGHRLSESSGKWIDICFDKINISKGLIKKGKNTVTVEQIFNEKSNLEALYLLGDFGVELRGIDKILVGLPQNIGYGELKKYKLPFYSGSITYKFKTDVNERGRVVLDELFGAACAKINGNMVAFRPYEAVVEDTGEIDIELVLTRRNTFGPLHQQNLYEYAYGPGNFITEGKDYSEEYRLYPMGLTKPPMLEY